MSRRPTRHRAGGFPSSGASGEAIQPRPHHLPGDRCSDDRPRRGQATRPNDGEFTRGVNGRACVTGVNAVSFSMSVLVGHLDGPPCSMQPRDKTSMTSVRFPVGSRAFFHSEEGSEARVGERGIALVARNSRSSTRSRGSSTRRVSPSSRRLGTSGRHRLSRNCPLASTSFGPAETPRAPTIIPSAHGKRNFGAFATRVCRTAEKLTVDGIAPKGTPVTVAIGALSRLVDAPSGCEGAPANRLQATPYSLQANRGETPRDHAP